MFINKVTVNYLYGMSMYRLFAFKEIPSSDGMNKKYNKYNIINALNTSWLF